MKNIVARQHSETELSEIAGDVVERILAVRGTGNDGLVLFYVFIRGFWLRIFLDAGVLFLNVCDGPNAEDDLSEGDEYLDLSENYGINGEEVSKAFMKNGVFRIAFKSGAEFIFEQIGEKTKFRFIKAVRRNL
jgi:hypothetical protein